MLRLVVVLDFAGVLAGAFAGALTGVFFVAVVFAGALVPTRLTGVGAGGRATLRVIDHGWFLSKATGA